MKPTEEQRQATIAVLIQRDQALTAVVDALWSTIAPMVLEEAARTLETDHIAIGAAREPGEETRFWCEQIRATVIARIRSLGKP